MTTDNRTNEPTDEQVEAAAKELAVYEWVSWEVAPNRIKVLYRAQARAALVAAQGAAPQADALLSGGVDEDKLAEVVCLALDHRDGGEECEDDYRVARAVAEWLKGQGNAARE